MNEFHGGILTGAILMFLFIWAVNVMARWNEPETRVGEDNEHPAPKNRVSQYDDGYPTTNPYSPPRTQWDDLEDGDRR